MPPYYVQGFEDYLAWFYEILHGSGAVDTEPAEVTIYENESLAADGTIQRLAVVSKYILKFYDGSRLQISFMITERLDGTYHESLGLELNEYSYDYRDADDQLLWRYDRHAEIHHGFLVATHSHIGSEDNVAPTDAVEIDSVISNVLRHLAD